MKGKILGLLAVGLLTGPVAANAAVIYESATLGGTGVRGGFVMDRDSFIGARFSLSSATNITAIGGHLSVSRGTMFGAIVSLDGPDALPHGDPFDEAEVLASTTFGGTEFSADRSIPLSVTLGPGNYALVFGSGLFGARQGSGNMPDNNPEIGSPTYIAYLGGDFGWVAGASIEFARFVVYGDEDDEVSVPEPGSLALLALGLAGLGVSRRRKAA